MSQHRRFQEAPRTILERVQLNNPYGDISKFLWCYGKGRQAAERPFSGEHVLHSCNKILNSAVYCITESYVFTDTTWVSLHSLTEDFSGMHSPPIHHFMAQLSLP
jgi:hypothetical protein